MYNVSYAVHAQQNNMSQEKEKSEKLSGSAIREMWRNSVRILSMTYALKPKMIIGIFGVFAVAAATTFGSSGIRALLINELVAGTGSGIWSNTIILFFMATVGMSLLPDVIYQLRDFWSWVLWFSMEEKFNIMILNQRGKLDVASHEDPKTQDMFTRVNENGVWRLSNFMDRMFYMLQNILEIIVAGLIILTLKWWLCLIVVVGVIPTLIVEARYSRSAYGIDTAKAEIKRRYWDLQSHFRNLSNVVEIKLLSLSENFLNRITSLFRQFRGPEEISEYRKLKKGTGASLISNLSMAVAVGWSVNEVLAGRMQVGTLTFVFASVINLHQALSGFLQNLARQYKDSLYLTDTFKFLDLKPRIETGANSKTLESDVTPGIVFENVSFSYPDSKALILKNINLVVGPGEKLAVVGVNGAGKTTLIKLLCRFYDPTKGRIMIGGVDLRELDLGSWYAKLGSIFQDYSNYNFAVKESIAIARPGSSSTLEKVKEAAKSAEADIFIDEFEKKYSQQLGKEFEGGVEPSIGQWQKLALARTFYRDPRILILDEPTSSIDAEAEAKIFDKLEALPDDRTVLLISHRFSTVRHAHKIIVLENGTISEAGTHKELLKLEGTYARLFKLQARGYI